MLVEIADYASEAAPTINPAKMMEINRRHGLEIKGPPILSVPNPTSPGWLGAALCWEFCSTISTCGDSPVRPAAWH